MRRCLRFRVGTDGRGAQRHRHRLSIPYFFSFIEIKNEANKEEDDDDVENIYPSFGFALDFGNQYNIVTSFMRERQMEKQNRNEKEYFMLLWQCIILISIFLLIFFFAAYISGIVCYRGATYCVGSGRTDVFQCSVLAIGQTTESQFLRNCHIMYLNAWCMRFAAPAPMVKHPALTQWHPVNLAIAFPSICQSCTPRRCPKTRRNIEPENNEIRAINIFVRCKLNSNMRGRAAKRVCAFYKHNRKKRLYCRICHALYEGHKKPFGTQQQPPSVVSSLNDSWYFSSVQF